MVKLLADESPEVTLMTVIQVPRTFLDSLDDKERRSFLDESDPTSAENLAHEYLEERGRRFVDPLLAALRGEEIDAQVEIIEGDNPAEVIGGAGEHHNAQIIMMGATRRIFQDDAWTSVSAQVMEKSPVPLLLIPGMRSEDTGELPRVVS
jgi:nucleotide-binding universal stress UspA family protein